MYACSFAAISARVFVVSTRGRARCAPPCFHLLGVTRTSGAEPRVGPCLCRSQTNVAEPRVGLCLGRSRTNGAEPRVGLCQCGGGFWTVMTS